MQTSCLRDLKLPSFQSEKLLQQAVAGLLGRMPGITRVQILHSAQEFGKDIIFQWTDPLGETMQCACVIKNSKISGKITENSSTRAILFQIEQALDTPFLDGSGADCRVSRVYVISPEEIGQSAIRAISGKLKERKGQVVFMDGSRLFKLFREHWVDFFADEYSSIEGHIEVLSREVSRNAIATAANNYNLGPISTSEATIYVRRTLSRNLSFFVVNDVYHLVDSAWKTEWKRVDIEALRRNLSLLTEMIEYLSGWGFFQKGKSQGGMYSLLNSLEAFSTKMLKAWLREAERVVSEPIGLGDTTPGTVVILPNQDSLEIEFSELLDRVNQGLGPLRAACAAATRLPSDGVHVSILSDPNWKMTSALNDCARYSPVDVLSPRRGLHADFEEAEVLSHPGPLLIVGAAGYGKTSFCRWHALADVEAFRKGESSILPVYIPLNTIATSKLDSFEEAFLLKAGKSALLTESSLKQAAGVRLYLDGLDEVPSISQRSALINLVKKGPAAKELKVQIILTARDYVVGRDFLDIPRVELSPLTEEQKDDLMAQWFRLSPNAREDFEKQLDNTPALKSLMQVPLLATLTLLVFRQTGRLPESRTRLYSIFVELLSGGWDLAKGTLRPSRFGQAPKIMILGALAANVHTKRLRYFPATEVIAAAEGSMRSSQINYQEVVDELLMDGVIARSGESYFFSHFSFQEFLAAREFRGDPQSVEINRALRRFSAGDDWWREILRFYIGLAENPGKVAQWLVRSSLEIKGETLRATFAWIEEFFPSYDLKDFLRDNL